MNNEEKRETIIIPEKKEKIERIKRKYKNPNMDDKTAGNVRKLEVTNNILLGATALVGLITTIDLIVPDPVLGIDEAILAGVTALLGTVTTIVNNKIKDLAATGSADVQMEEVQKISSQMQDVARAVAAKKNAKTEDNSVGIAK